MSPISLSMDLLLAVLLIAALGFCWRLERRLKGLRDSHADFAVAVADLDRAAQRAETGLAQLREATDEAADLLAGRIEKARELAAKLERASLAAATLSGPRPANDMPRPAPVRAVPNPAAPRAVPQVDPVIAAESLARRLSGDGRLIPQRPVPIVGGPASQRVAQARPNLDDDLFEAPARATAQAGRRS
jgi:hypothetical protein